MSGQIRNLMRERLIEALRYLSAWAPGSLDDVPFEQAADVLLKRLERPFPGLDLWEQGLAVPTDKYAPWKYRTEER